MTYEHMIKILTSMYDNGLSTKMSTEEQGAYLGVLAALHERHERDEKKAAVVEEYECDCSDCFPK